MSTPVRRSTRTRRGKADITETSIHDDNMGQSETESPMRATRTVRRKLANANLFICDIYEKTWLAINVSKCIKREVTGTIEMSERNGPTNCTYLT